MKHLPYLELFHKWIEAKKLNDVGTLNKIYAVDTYQKSNELKYN